MNRRISKPALFLFVKTPWMGQVKTRMSPALCPQSCIKLAEQMLRHMSVTLCQHWTGPRAIYAWPDTNHVVFRQLQAEFDIDLRVQQGRDLGERMHHAISQSVAAGVPAAVVGTDIPQISGEIFLQAEQCLIDGKEVIGPAADGGFYLLGLQTSDHGLFQDIEWGGSDVLNRFLKKAQDRGRHLHHLPMLRDIDEVNDLVWLAKQDIRYRPFLSTLTRCKDG